MNHVKFNFDLNLSHMCCVYLSFFRYSSEVLYIALT